MKIFSKNAAVFLPYYSGSFPCTEINQKLSLKQQKSPTITLILKCNLDLLFFSDTLSGCHYCHFCDRRYSTEGNLKRHIRSVHSGIKAFKCQRCEMEFDESWKLKRHFNSVHLNLKLYKCRYCSVSFSRSDKRCLHEKSKHLNLKI